VKFLTNAAAERKGTPLWVFEQASSSLRHITRRARRIGSNHPTNRFSEEARFRSPGTPRSPLLNQLTDKR
jgi:hypothetical protein